MDKKRQYLHNPLISGTLLLTGAAFFNKIIGFFYRIFLARVFQDEGLGLLGLIAPVSMLMHALCVSGLQNAITRCVAGCQDKKGKAFCYLFTGGALSLLLSCAFLLGTLTYAEEIALRLLHEPRTAPLLRIVAFSFPLAALHACINGYFYGRKKAAIPCVSLIIEQLSRVICVFVLCRIYILKNAQIPLSVAVAGLFIGECSAALFSCAWLFIHSAKADYASDRLLSLPVLRELSALAAPLSLNRVISGIFLSAEAVLLPLRLADSGLSTTQALSVYGVFSGMALPLVMFPCALTGSAATLLLPSVAEAQARGDNRRIRNAVIVTILTCFLLGFGCMLFLFLFAGPVGRLLFHSEEAALQIRALSFVCPFLYLSGMLGSILHGLGKAGISFFCSLSALAIRLFFVIFIVPQSGINGYFFGILCSQICQDFLFILALHHIIIYNKSVC